MPLCENINFFNFKYYSIKTRMLFTAVWYLFFFDSIVSGFHSNILLLHDHSARNGDYLELNGN